MIVGTLLPGRRRLHPRRDIGVVIKRFGLRNLQPGQIIALRGEAGYQADTLAPGLHFWLLALAVRHRCKAPVIVVPQGEIALVVAAAGAADPARPHPRPGRGLRPTSRTRASLSA